MTTLCIIPARLQSRRFPEKLLYPVQGVSILERTFRRAKLSSRLDQIFIAIDDVKMEREVLSFGGTPLWTSPDCPNGTFRIIEALEKNRDLQQSSYILNLQADHPCTSEKTIDAVLSALEEDPTASMATAAVLIERREDFFSPHVVKVVFDHKGKALYFSRSPIPYTPPGEPIVAYAHLGIYAYRTSFLLQMRGLSESVLQKKEDLEQLRVLENGDLVKIALVQDPAIGIDVPEDIDKLEEFLCKNTSLSPEGLSPLWAKG